MSVVAATERDLAAIGKMAPEIADSALAACALALAALVDDVGNSATARSMCARELREVLNRLRELTPAKDQGDVLDELARRRDTRRGVAAT